MTQQPMVANRPFRRWHARAGLAAACVAVLLVASVPAPAQIDSREGIALQNQLYQLRQDLQILRSEVEHGGGAPAAQGGDVAAQLLSRVQAMEEQVRQLRGRIDETQNLIARQNADLSKRLDDLAFQMNLSNKTGGGLSSAIPAPPPVREVAPRPVPPEPARADLTRPPEPARATEPARAPEAQARLDLTPRPPAVVPAPVVIPPPPAPPPRSFTFNPAPDPMREFSPAAQRPAAQPAEPPKPVVEALIPPSRPMPRPPDPAVVPAEPARPVVAPPPRPAEPAPRQADTSPRSVVVPMPPPPVTDVAVAVPSPDGKRTPEMALQEGHAALARRDYAGAEKAAREVMINRTSPRAYDGQFLLAESLAGQRQFAQAAIAYDDAYNRSHKGRYAQEALVGLAGALTAISEKKAACETLGRLRTEFPQVRADLRDMITRTNDRAGCGRAGG